MDKRTLEAWDRSNPLRVERQIYANEPSYGGKIFRRPPMEFVMTFSVDLDKLQSIQRIALMYYQFDKYMKEEYGGLIDDYMEQQRARRIEDPAVSEDVDDIFCDNCGAAWEKKNGLKFCKICG